MSAPPPPKPGLKKAPPGKVLVKKGPGSPGAKSPGKAPPPPSPGGKKAAPGSPGMKSPAGVKAPPGAKAPPAGAVKKSPSPGAPKKLAGPSPGGVAKKSPAPPGAKSPGAPTMVKGPDGKMMMKKSPAAPGALKKAPMPGAKPAPAAPGTPGGKAPTKLVPKAKVPLKAPPGAGGAVPIKAPAPKLAMKKPPTPPSEGAPNEPPKTPLEGTADPQTDEPIPTPRDMPSTALPPPTPGGQTEFGGSPREQIDLLLTPQGGEAGSPRAADSIPGGFISPMDPFENVPSRPQNKPGPPTGTAEWPAHHMGVSQSVDAQEMETQKRKYMQLEAKLAQSEQFVSNLQNEVNRLRETLYEREGVKVVQHIAELERENNYLRIQLTREKDAALRHQSAHMATMDELVELRNSVGAHGDYTRLQKENADLNKQISELVHANTQLSLRIADVDHTMSLSNLALDASGPMKESEKSTYVRVRRGALCPTCVEMVNRLETIMLRRSHENSAIPQPVQHIPGASHSQQLIAGLTQTPTRGGTPGRAAGTGYASVGPTSPSPGQIALDGAITTPSRQQHPSAHHDPMISSSPGSAAGGVGHLGSSPSAANPSASGGRAPMTSMAAEGWRVLRLPNGNTVYHNIISNRSQMDVPPQLAGGGGGAEGVPSL